MKAKNFFRQLYNSRLKRILRRMPACIQKAVYRYRDYIADVKDPFEKIPRVYITLRCNLKCPYCSDGLAYDMSDMKYDELTGDKWVEIINTLPGNSIIFTGGEPVMHRDLPDIINNIKQENIFLYTNLAYDVRKFMDQLTKPVTVFSSFHPNNKSVSLENSIAAILILENHPMCSGVASHHIIEHQSNGSNDEIRKYKKCFEEAGIDLLIYGNQFITNNYGTSMCDMKKIKTVNCSYDRLIIGPDGNRIMCVSKMIRKTSDRIVSFDTELPMMLCDEFGKCSPCDEVAEIRQK